jgi:hypothetical protein
MKIVQSYWSAPAREKDNQDLGARPIGGWPAAKYNLISWALSCLKLREFYTRVELVTDIDGRKLLVDELKLPYSAVSTDLENLKYDSGKLWSLGKIYSYSIQKEPFIHVDGDVFIWDSFPRRIEQAPLIAQHRERNFKIYKSVLADFVSRAQFVPELFSIDNTDSINAGIVGGNDFQFFANFFETVREIVLKNRTFLSDYSQGNINLILEQYYLYQIGQSKGKHFEYYFEQMPEDYSGCLNFNLVPHFQNFIHVIGHAKKDKLACLQMEQLLRYEFPVHYKRIMEMLGETMPPQGKLIPNQSKNLKTWRNIAPRKIFETYFLLSPEVKLEEGNMTYIDPITGVETVKLLNELETVIALLWQPMTIEMIVSAIVGAENLTRGELETLKHRLIDIISSHIFYHHTITFA